MNFYAVKQTNFSVTMEISCFFVFFSFCMFVNQAVLMYVCQPSSINVAMFFQDAQDTIIMTIALQFSRFLI